MTFLTFFGNIHIDVIYFAIANALIWVVISIRQKQLRKKGLSSLGTLGLFSAGLPLWIITLIVLNNYTVINYESQYLFMVGYRVIAVIISNLLGLYLIKFRGLSELVIYKLGISILLGIFADIFFFHIPFSYFTILALICFFVASVLLTKKDKSPTNKHKHLLRDLGIITIIGGLGIFCGTTYKLGLGFQENPITHGMIAQIFAHSFGLLLCLKSMIYAYKKQIITIKDILIFGILIYIFTVFEAIIYKGLPISVITVLSVLKLGIFAMYDIKTKEIKPSLAIFLAIGLSIIGLVLVKLG